MHSYLFFEKYQGTGNDFILVDQRQHTSLLHNNQEHIARLCDRHFGIGADGLILLEQSDKADFRMVYFNADGKQSTLCGNGGRCIIQFAHQRGVFSKETQFEAIDGIHRGRVDAHHMVELEMKDVNEIHQLDPQTYELNTGSPHFVAFGSIPENIKEAGAAVRYNETYRKQGINVNFVQLHGDHIEVATYERGVEDETFSCGTGVTASVLAWAVREFIFGELSCAVTTKGGTLSVSARRQADGSFTDIWLRGPAIKVFEGKILL